MSSDVVTLEVSEYVAVATLNRPPVNAINAEMRNRIIEIFDEATDRPDIRVVVLTAQGKVFSAGADLKQRPDAAKPGNYWHHNRITRETGNAIKECAKPVIAAVNGAALGAGFGLMAAWGRLRPAAISARNAPLSSRYCCTNAGAVAALAWACPLPSGTTAAPS